MSKPSAPHAQYQHPQSMISTDWLAANLDQDGLLIFDCTTYLKAPDDNSAYEVVSGRADYLQAHIPGAAFLDLQTDLSDPKSQFRFTMPAPDDLARGFAQAGINHDARVVLYSRASPQWATRIWWMLRAIGFDNAAILDGGWEKWQQEGRAVVSGEQQYPQAALTAHARAGLFVNQAEVLAAIEDPSVCVVNALSAELHAGHSRRYGRPGRIPGSVNVAAAGLRDPNSLTLVDANEAARQFEQAGVVPENRTVIYCGGGIAATLDAFVLHQLGHTDIAVYDHSLNEWSNDAALPMESD